MSEKKIISPVDAKQAAENIADALDGNESSPINPEYIRNFFELSFAEDNVWVTLMAMMDILKDSHAKLLTEKEIHVDVMVLTSYLESIRLTMLESMMADKIELEIDGLRDLAAPIVEELTKAGKEQTAAKILEALGDLREFPFDAAMTLYTNLQIAQSMDVVHGEIAKENLETLYQLIQGLVEEGMSARLNYR
jgi:hypothetical protein